MNDVIRFSEGDCWILMKRLHRLTGWPCFAFIRGEDEACVHGFVQRPDGLFLDVEGLWCHNELWEEYAEGVADEQAWDIVEFPLDEFAWVTPAFGEYSYKRARIVADRLLDKYGAPWYST